jgi:hypothetical protein
MSQKTEFLVDHRNSWIPKALCKAIPFQAIYNGTLHTLKVQEAETALEAAVTFAKEELAAIGSEYTSIFPHKKCLLH